jgi:dihydropteroate synthase
MILRCRDRELDVGTRAAVMGILNVTDNSFSDGGQFLSTESAVAHALDMIGEGADIIDVGGESTRPGAAPVPEDEELRRVVPVIEALARQTDCTISIDTSKARVAEAAVRAGARIINDVTGLRGDPEMVRVAADTGAGVVLMHMQGTPRDMQKSPRYRDVVAEIREFFRLSYAHALRSGIHPMSVAFDPGIGFGKTVAHNLELLARSPELRVEERPLLYGVSRKSFLGRVLGSDDLEDRFWPTVALTSFLREKGVNLFRVHDVRPNREALRMTEAILQAT